MNECCWIQKVLYIEITFLIHKNIVSSGFLVFLHIASIQFHSNFSYFMIQEEDAPSEELSTEAVAAPSPPDYSDLCVSENYHLMGYKVAELGRNAREFLLLRRGPWPSEEALRYQQRFVADMQETEARLASGEVSVKSDDDSKIKSIEDAQADPVDDDDDGLTISFVMGSDDYAAPLDMVAPNEQTIIIVHPEPDGHQQDSHGSTYQQQVQPQGNHQGTPAPSHSSGPLGLVLPFGAASYAFIDNLEDMALELMATSQPVPFPPPVIPSNMLLPSGPVPEAFAPPSPPPRGTGQTSPHRHQVGSELAIS